MEPSEGASYERSDQVDFDSRERLEFRNTQFGSDGGLPVMRELDDAPGLTDPTSAAFHPQSV